MSTQNTSYPEVYLHAQMHFEAIDPVMARLMREVGELNFEPGGDLFEALVTSIISQVVSTAAADTVKRRLLAHTENLISPEVLHKIDQETFRSFGIGAQKYGYISNLAKEFLQRPDHFEGFSEMSDAEVLARLTSLKGIGKWTAQMVLIFNLGRLDIFAPDDLALRNATIQHYGLAEEISRKELEKHAEIWLPYRSIASVYLWNSIRKWT